MESRIIQLAAAVKAAFAPSERYRRPSDERKVLVDLTVDGLQSWLTQPLLAKYISWGLDAVPCGVTFDVAALSNGARAMYDAFGCNRFFGLATAARRLIGENPNLQATGAAIAAALPAEGPALREKLLALEFDGLPVGDLIYDTHLRQSGKPTVDRLDDRLKAQVAEAYLIYKASEAILDSGRFEALVTFHMVYYHLGILSRLALAKGIPVYQNLSVNPFRIRRFENFLNARDAVGMFEPREFQRVWRGSRAAAVAWSRDYLERRFAGRAELGFNDGVDGAYGCGRRRYAKEELCRALNWDPDRPIVVLMSHVFHESPHAVGDNLYPDYYEWLKETLEVAAATPDVQWLLKKHPQQKHFDDLLRHSPDLVPDDEAMRRLLAPAAGKPHVALCPDDLHTAGLIAAAHAIVTQHGRAGYEFAACGVPVVTAARPAYGGLGFTEEPRTRQAYLERLRSIADLRPLSEEAQERALTYIYMFFERSRARTTMLPDIENRGFWAPPLGEEFLAETLDRLQSFDPRRDPLWLRVQAMLRDRSTGLLDLDDA